MMKIMQKAKSLLIRLQRCWPLYVFIAPPLVYLAVMHYYPMYGAQIAFRRFRASLGISGSPWVGWTNFIRFFNDYQFARILKNTLLISCYTLLAGFFIRIILALSINAIQSKRYQKIVQMVTYMPHFISTVVMVGILTQFFNPRLGIIAKMLLPFGISRDLMGIPAAFSHIYVWSGIWQSTGWGTIVYLAALAGVDPNLHEAALCDGASRLQRVWYIDLPAILPTAAIMLIMDAGRVMSLGFEKVYLMQNSLNLSASQVISTYVYEVSLGSGRNDFSYGAAIGLFNSVINFILVLTVNKISKNLNQSSLW
jgi:ABC-type polysaccharide transport system permease subunit